MKLLSSSSIIASTALAITTSEDCKYPRQFHPSWGHFMRLSRLYSSAPEGNLKLYSFYFINLINMLLEGSRWGYKKITAAFTSSRTGLSDVVIRTTKCTKAIASISSVVSRHATQGISLFSVAILKNETAAPFPETMLMLSNHSKIELLFDFPPSLIWADMSITSFENPISPFPVSNIIKSFTFYHKFWAWNFVLSTFESVCHLSILWKKGHSHSGPRAKCPKKSELHNPSVYHLRPGGVHFAANTPPYGSNIHI